VSSDKNSDIRKPSYRGAFFTELVITSLHATINMKTVFPRKFLTLLAAYFMCLFYRSLLCGREWTDRAGLIGGGGVCVFLHVQTNLGPSITYRPNNQHRQCTEVRSRTILAVEKQ
jgi:hypothetical protein